MSRMTYFWTEYGRLDGFTADDKARQEFPQLYLLWDQFKALEAAISALVKELEE